MGNIPNQYTRDMLFEQLDKKGFGGTFDFLYLPIDRSSDRNMGYAFINFRQPGDYEAFVVAFDGVEAGQCLPGFASPKVCEVRPAEVQGQCASWEKMCRPSFLEPLWGHDAWQPVFFDHDGQRFPLVAIDPNTGISGAGAPSGKKGSRKKSGSESSHQSPAVSPELGPQNGKSPKSGKQRSNPNSPYSGPSPGGKPGKSPNNQYSNPNSPYLNPSPMLLPMMPPMGMLPYADWSEGGMMPPAAAVALAAAQANAKAMASVGDAAPVPKVRKQIEFYLSATNIGHDLYLRSLMDADGWISLEEILKFPKMRSLGVSAADALVACSKSSSVEVEHDRQCVRIANEALREAFPHIDPSAVKPAGGFIVGGNDAAAVPSVA